MERGSSSVQETGFTRLVTLKGPIKRGVNFRFSTLSGRSLADSQTLWPGQKDTGLRWRIACCRYSREALSKAHRPFSKSVDTIVRTFGPRGHWHPPPAQGTRQVDSQTDIQMTTYLWLSIVCMFCPWKLRTPGGRVGRQLASQGGFQILV